MTEIEVLPLYYKYVLTQNYPINILVGGRASGKSFFMEQLVVTNLHNKSKYKMLIVEDTETNIGTGVKSGIENRVEEFGFNSLFTSTKQPAEIKHKNGNSVIFRGYHSEAQQKQTKSLNEVTAIWYEESEKITYEQFKALRILLRGGNSEDRQLFLSLNPIGEDGFINNYFFKQEPDKILVSFPDGRPKVFVKNITTEIEVNGEIIENTLPAMVVVTTHNDNPFLSMEQHADIEEYKHTNSDLYAMLAEGRFVKGSGAFFQVFNKDTHVIEPIVLPQHWRRYCAIDYGLDCLSVLFCAVDEDGNYYIYKEIHESDLTVTAAAKRILEYTLPSEEIYQHLIPPDLHNRNRDTGRSTAEVWEQLGLKLHNVNNRFEMGCNDAVEWLTVVNGTSKINIFNHCKELIKSLSNIQRDKRNPNVYAKEPHELTHSADSFRYLFSGRPTTPKVVVVPDHSEYNRIFGISDNSGSSGYMDW